MSWFGNLCQLAIVIMAIGIIYPELHDGTVVWSEVFK